MFQLENVKLLDLHVFKVRFIMPQLENVQLNVLKTKFSILLQTDVNRDQLPFVHLLVLFIIIRLLLASLALEIKHITQLPRNVWETVQLDISIMKL